MSNARRGAVEPDEPDEAKFDEPADGEACGRRLRPDVQAAIEVIGSRTSDLVALEQDADYMPDLQGAFLVRLALRDGNLSGRGLCRLVDSPEASTLPA